MPSIHVGYGQLPKHAYLRRDGSFLPAGGSDTPFQAAAGSNIVFTVPIEAAESYAGAERIAGRIEHIDIKVDPIYFADESKWQGGEYYLPQNAPVVWSEVSPAEFLTDK